MNRKLAIHVIEELIKQGVEEFVLCPAGRNAPFVHLLSHSSLSCSNWPEERSAAFFALGVARRTNRPVAIFTTSGTASGELLPAVMEAYYSSIPLILVTADRPRRYRGSNAPQSAEQVGLFGVYAPFSFDIEGEERCSLVEWSGRSPLHLNVCFEEPKDDPFPFSLNMETHSFHNAAPLSNSPALLEWSAKCKKPLVVVSTLAKKTREATVSFLQALGAPVYLEGISGLRNDKRLEDLQVVAPRLNQHDAVLRVGGVPTHRFWRDLEDMQGQISVLSITENPFSGLSWAPFVHTDIEGYLRQNLISKSWDFPEEFYERQNSIRMILQELIEEEPMAEPSLMHNLSLRIPQNALVYLGNSLPIRNWDLTASYHDATLDIQATRGLNGIDGQLSCFFGLCKPKQSNIAILGDLTALYDFAGCWYAKALNGNFTIVVVNNRGGQIFSRKFQNPAFINPHRLNFEHFAKFWNMPYQLWEEVPNKGKMNGLIELAPEKEATNRFWEKWDERTKQVMADLVLCK